MAKTRSQATPTKSPRSSKKAVAAGSPSVKRTTEAKPKKADKITKPKAAAPRKADAKGPAKKAKTAHKAETESEPTVSAAVPTKVALRALAELAGFAERELQKTVAAGASTLFDEDADASTLYLQLSTKKYVSSTPNLKPKLIKLAHPWRDALEVRTCLIVRDLLITSEEQLERIEAENYQTLQRIVSMKELKTEYKPYEKRRQLHADFDLFLADDACINMLPQALGKIFYGPQAPQTKAPLAVRVVSTSRPLEFLVDTFKNQLARALQLTLYLPPIGTNISVPFGSLGGLLELQLAENLQAVVGAFAPAELRAVAVKTATSPALPVFVASHLHDSADVAEEDKPKTKNRGEVKLLAFERGLLELGDAEDVAKLIGKKLGKVKA